MIRRVAFSAVGGAGWLGGQNYLRNLLQVLRRYAGSAIEPVVLAGTDADGEALVRFGRDAGIEVFASDDFNADRLRRRALSTFAIGRDQVSEHHFKGARVDAIFESGSYYGWRAGYPIVSWYPDFQHRHLPAMFRPTDRWRRDLLLRARMAGSRIFMLSSRTAEADCLRFFPKAAGRTTAVPFAVLTPPDIAANADAVLARHGIAGSYVFLPNQFWRHKNHAVVIDALSLLASRSIPVHVIASGLQQDVRDPGHFPALADRIAHAGIGDAFRMLGVIPYADLTTLMGNAAAVLNPSLFEGWSTTVEEAKALGVPLLLSDIPVHREQVGERASFFPVDDAEALAAVLASFPPTVAQPDDAFRRAGARSGQEARLLAFADGFTEAVDRAVTHHLGN